MLYLVVGKSGSGKDTLIRSYCELFNKECVNSYTTRKPRGENDYHIFVSPSEFDEIRNDLVAYTLFDGNEYGATNEQCKNADFYILDWDGIEYFKQKCNIPFKIIYIMTSKDNRFLRMVERGDSEQQAIQRINHDEIKFEGVKPNDIDYTIVNDTTLLNGLTLLRKFLLDN